MVEVRGGRLDGRGGGIEVRRGGDRFVTAVEGRTTHHSFSFEEHYDPANVGFGALLCHNDDRLEPGCGYRPHPHRDVEIVSWVLEGALRHDDSHGHHTLVVPGWVQRTSAGSGTVHSEVADADGGRVRFVQVWVRPDQPGGVPSYHLGEAGHSDGWVALASGLRRDADRAVTTLSNRSAALWAARLGDGGSLALPEAEWLHLFVATGGIELEGAGRLAAGDAARLTRSGGQRLTASGSAELLLWEMHRPG